MDNRKSKKGGVYTWIKSKRPLQVNAAFVKLKPVLSLRVERQMKMMRPVGRDANVQTKQNTALPVIMLNNPFFNELEIIF